MKLLKISVFPWAALLLLLGATPSSQLLSQTETWQLVWSDEFNETGHPNPQWWDYETGYVRNNELQYYTNARLENCRRENGFLVIEARKDNFEGNSITSASITSRRSASWTYGKFEVRAQVAPGRGTWPAIWMLGDNIGEVGWPHCGEIDIMEFVGYDPTTIHGTVHTTAYNHIQNTARGGSIGLANLTDSMRVYSVEWEPQEIRFYVDGQLYFTFPNDGKGNDATWPFHRPQHLKLNLAIGGDWGGAQGVDNDIYPTRFLIDYVRVYQRPQDGPFTVSLQAKDPGKLQVEPAKPFYQAGETVTLVADPDIGMRLGKWKNVQVDRSLRAKLTVDRPLLVEADFIDPSSLLRNTGFADGLNEWYRFIDSSATATLTATAEEKAQIAVTKSGTADWHVQFGQAGFALQNGSRYELSFDARTVAGNPKLIAAIAQNAPPYATFLSTPVSLEPTEQSYKLSFTHSQASEPNARVEFRLGTQVGTVALDNVRLVNLDASPLSDYEQWKQSHAIRPIADDQDPDQDFRPNLVEYILDSSPSQSDSYLPLVRVSKTPTQTKLVANIDLDPLPSDVTATVEESEDLISWQETEDPGRKFQRLKIETTPPIQD